ncbi:MAG: hypothetical protein SO013_06035 [Prevotella sp.]|nr:hypothetical protein [Prevotella sp.]
MNIIIQKNITITNPAQWLLAAPPQKGIQQWKDRYSAKELAKYITQNANGFNALIKDIIKDTFGSKCSDQQLIGEPERITNLPPKESKGPRCHDLFLSNSHVVIGVEAKVNETFDNELYKENTTENKKIRVEWLTKTILSKHYDELDDNEKTLRYQLFTATAGTLLEAKQQKRCIVLVLSFRDVSAPINTKNDDDFKNFVSRVCGEGRTHKVFTIDAQKIDCHFVKKEITFTTENNIEPTSDDMPPTSPSQD